MWTNEQAAAALRRSGAGMSDGYISQLRNGKKNNPSARNLASIAELFGVPVDYFFNAETAAKIDADLRLLVAVRDIGVQGVALRAHGLSPESMASLEGIIDQVRKFEHLAEHARQRRPNRTQPDDAPSEYRSTVHILAAVIHMAADPYFSVGGSYYPHPRGVAEGDRCRSEARCAVRCVPR